jgi:isoquinoline 1-oxidoreductase alpha subunit
MAAIDFLRRNPSPDDRTIRRSMLNYCRCGTYPVIAAAIAEAAAGGGTADGTDRESS